MLNDLAEATKASDEKKRVRVKRHAIHHGCIVYAQKIRGRLLQEFIASWKIGREHSTYCGRNLVCDQPVLQYSIGLRTYHF